MRICLISVEIFAWGKYGGFGRATRTIGRELAKRGHEVFAVVPRRQDQQRIEQLDGITVYGFSPWRPWEALEMFREIQPEICHSCEPSHTSVLAMRALPRAKHMVTFRDPRDSHDWWLELKKPSLSYLQVLHNYFFENNLAVRRSIRRMDAVYTIGKYLVPKVKRMYGLERDPEFLPTPVSVPENVVKAKRPTVCYVARLDRRKRPELFFDMAAKFPEVEFLVLGKSRDAGWERRLREKYEALPNVSMLGFVDQFSDPRHKETLEKSWVLVNTATREALPNSFIEATSHGCAILSEVDPDGFASELGYHAADGDFEAGLRYLLKDDNWRRHGQRAYEYTLETFETSRSIDRHERIYAALLKQTQT
jgi:glycosyltransferase involved in cell wall biosynthesis